MRYPRGPLPGGPAALLLVAVIALPELLKQCKPAAKAVGDFLIKAGNEVQRIAEVDKGHATPKTEHSGTVVPDASPNADVIESSESKSDDQANREAASPIGHHEVDSHIAADAKGNAEFEEPINPEPRKEEKPMEPDQPQNPKRPHEKPSDPES